MGISNAEEGTSNSRLLFVDATRGLAMGLVCLSHFGLFYFWNAGAFRASDIIFHVALPATPTFMLVSGVVLGMLLAPGGRGGQGLKDKMVDRGLFLLGPGHLLVRAAHWKVIATAPAASHWLFATDCIAVSLVLGIWLVPRTRSWARAALGVAMIAASWVTYLDWWPRALYGVLFKDFVFGETQSASNGVIFPLLPWLGFYLVAAALGEQLAVWRQQSRDLARSLLLVGVPLLAAGELLHACRRLTTTPGIQLLFSAGQKYPPSPAYLLFGAGAAVLLLGMNAWLVQQRYFLGPLRLFALVGRNSLVVFVLQYFVYYCVFLVLRLPFSNLWPLYFLLSLVVNFGAAWGWERYFGNKYLTVGWPWFRRASTVALAQTGPPARPKKGI